MKTIYYISLILLIAFSSSSCKTQKENIKPVAMKENRTIQVKEKEINKDKEDKSEAEKQGLLNKQKINEFAEKKASLLCSLKGLMKELEKTNDENMKTKINSKIGQLKKELTEFDDIIKASLPEQELVNEVEKKVGYLVKDC
jgi:biopolymer transport protein ExbB/TolQ